MKFKVEFEIDEKKERVSKKEVREYLNFEFGITSALEKENTFAYCCLGNVIKKVNIAELEK
jgi:hypothetical protein